MAVDTRDKRMSMLGLFQPVPSVLPNPDGTVGAQDRAMFLWLYYGLTLSVSATQVVCNIAVTVADILTFNVTVSDIVGFNVEVGC